MFSNGSLSVSSQSQAAGLGRWRDLSPVSPASVLTLLRTPLASRRQTLHTKEPCRWRKNGWLLPQPSRAGGLQGSVNGSKPSLFQFRALLGRAMRWATGRRLNSEQVNVNLHCIAHYVIRPSGIIVCRSVKISAVLRLFDDDTQDFAKLKKHVNRSFPLLNGTTEGLTDGGNTEARHGKITARDGNE